MKKIIILLVISLNILAQEVKRSPELKKDYANVFFNTNYTLFDFFSDEPIFPDKSGKYDIIISSNENKSPQKFTGTGLELSKLMMFKFKSLETHRKWAQGDIAPKKVTDKDLDKLFDSLPEEEDIAPQAKSKSVLIKSDRTKNFGCVAIWGKSIGAIKQDAYDNFLKNRSDIHHIRINMELDKIGYYWHFFDSGLVFLEREDNLVKTHEGEWECVNSNNIKFKAPNLIKENEVLNFDSKSNSLTTEISSPSKKEIATNQNNRNKTVDDLEVDKAVKLLVAETNQVVKEMLAGWNGKPGVAKGCRRCKGTGIVKICPICNKTGKIHCKTCNGKRYTQNGKTCLTCSGTGIEFCHGCNGKVYNVKCLHNIFQFQH